MKTLLALVVLAGTAPAQEPGWPGFRGAGARGIADTSLFTRLGDEEIRAEIVWKRPVGSGYSGVAVAEGLAVTLCVDGTQDVVVAFDAHTGDERWRRTVGATYRGHDGSFDGPLATPVIDGSVVYTLGPQGDLAGRDLFSGEVVWSRDLMAEGVRQPDYGFASSPVVVGGVLVVQPGPQGALLSGYDLATGERVWSAGQDRTEYQSPSQSNGLVLAAGVSTLVAVDPVDGSVVWSYDHAGEGAHGAYSIVPVPIGNGVLISHRQDESALIQAGPAPGPLWETRALRKSYNVPVYYRDHIYGYSGFLLTCTDASSGELVWRSRQPGDGFLIAADGHLVVITKQGRLHIARAQPDGYRERAALNVLKPPVWSVPSMAGDRIYVRGMQEVVCVAIRAGAATVSAPPAGATDSPFQRFLNRAPHSREAVDAFLAACPSIPLIEGSNTVHFLYRGEARDMAIAGDMLGARRQEPMVRVEGTDLFYYTMELHPAARVNYLFVKDFVEMTDPGNSRITTTRFFGSEMEVSLDPSLMKMSWVAMPGWREPAHLAEPVRRGKLESTSIPSDRLGRDIRVDVYRPPGVDATAPYPVVYVHGGKPALERGDWVRSLDNLVGEEVEPLVAVFIDQEGMTMDHEVYAAMVVHELMPAFGTNRIAHVGMGVDSYLAAYTALRHPRPGALLGLQTMFMLDTMEQRMLALLAEDLPAMDVYLEWGCYDLRSPAEAWDMRDLNRRMWGRFRAKGFRLHGGEVPDGTGWSSWKNRTDKLLISLFPR